MTQSAVSRHSTTRSDFICLIVILGLATIFLMPALGPGHTLLPLGLEAGIAPWHKQVSQQAKNLLLSDPFYAFYPRRYFIKQAFQQGYYPLWNPYILGGHPALADTLSQTFYPPVLAATLLLSAARTLPVLAWFHLVIMGVLMYGFLRKLELRPASSLFGTIAWMLNGNMVVWLENPFRLSTLAWMPGVYLFYEIAMRRRKAWPLAIGGLMYGLSILGGHIQFALGIGISLAAYAMLHTTIRSRRIGRIVWQPLASAAMIGLLGAGIGAVQLLPAGKLVTMSQRHVMDADAFLSTRWPIEHTIGLWIPDFYGNPVRFPYWGALNYAEVTAYYGSFALALSLSAIVLTRRAEGRFFTALLAITVLIAAGTPVASLVAWIPQARYFRLNSLIAFIPFFGAAAAAFGLEASANRERSALLTIGTPAVCMICLVALTAGLAPGDPSQLSALWDSIAPQIWRTALFWLLGLVTLAMIGLKPALGISASICLLAVDLVQWGQPFNPVNTVDILCPENEVTTWLRADDSLYRVLPLQSDRLVFGPNVLSVFDFAETGGYSSVIVDRYRQLVKAIDDTVAVWWLRGNTNMLVNSRFDPLFSMLNAKYILISHQIEQPVTSVEETHPGCEEPELQLKSGSRITQTFEVHNPGLNRVDIEFPPTRYQGDAPLRFLLWRDREDGQLIADISVDTQELVQGGTHVFFFAPVPDSIGHKFVWALELPDAHNEIAIALCQAKEGPPGQVAFSAYSVQLELADIRQGVWIYRNPNTLPRAYVSHHVELVNDEQALRELRSAGFDPWHSVMIAAPAPTEIQDQLLALTQSPPTTQLSHVSILDYEANRVTVEAQLDKPGVLVLADTWYPGWKASVDGQDTTILRTNYALRGVYLDAGTHYVEFYFHPQSLYTGLVLSTAALILAALIVLTERRLT